MASSGKRSVAASRVPTPKKTGNQALDDESDLRRSCLQDIIDACIANPQHNMHLHGALLKRQRVANTEHGEGCFATISTLGRLLQDFSISYLTSHSDMSASEVVEAVRHDSDAIAQLLAYDRQLSASLRLSEHFINKDFCIRMLQRRSKQMGSRLQKFKASGGIAPTGAINWKVAGSYRLTFTEAGVLSTVTHAPTGDVAEAGANFLITRDWVMYENWSDSSAYIQKAPRPPYKLMIFWQSKSKLGAYSKPNYTGSKSTDLGREMNVEWDVFQDEQRGGMKAGAAEEAMECLNKIGQKRDALSKVRERAAEVVAKMRAKRTINLS